VYHIYPNTKQVVFLNQSFEIGVFAYAIRVKHSLKSEDCESFQYVRIHSYSYSVYCCIHWCNTYPSPCNLIPDVLKSTEFMCSVIMVFIFLL
jgi:hypothetical protein